MSTLRRARCGMFAVCIASAGVALADQRDLVPPQRPVPSHYFGLHIHKLVKPNRVGQISRWPEVGFGAWRLSESVKWKDLEPQRGSWNWALLDRYVATAEARGVRPVLPLGQTPGWASARASEESVWGRGAAAEPADLGDWARYVAAIASRYRGRIEAYELWNEPRYAELETVLRGGRSISTYSGTAAQMVRMAEVARRELKRADPQAILVSPSTDGREDKRLREFLKRGGGQFVDVVAHHFYIDAAEPDDGVLALVAMLRKAMAEGGAGDKPLWNTETGFVISGLQKLEPGQYPERMPVYSPEQAAPRVARMLLLYWALGVERVYWYGWDDGVYGLAADVGAGTPSAAGVAFDTVRGWMEGRVIQRCQQRQMTWTCNIVDAQRTRSWLVAWKHPVPGQEEPASLAVPEQFAEGRLGDLSGQWRPMPRTLRITSSPIILEAAP